MDGTSLEHNSQCHSLLPLYLPVMLGYPGVSWGEGTLSSLALPGRVRGSNSHVPPSGQLAHERLQLEGKPKF